MDCSGGGGGEGGGGGGGRIDACRRWRAEDNFVDFDNDERALSKLIRIQTVRHCAAPRAALRGIPLRYKMRRAVACLSFALRRVALCRLDKREARETLATRPRLELRSALFERHGAARRDAAWHGAVSTSTSDNNEILRRRIPKERYVSTLSKFYAYEKKTAAFDIAGGGLRCGAMYKATRCSISALRLMVVVICRESLTRYMVR